MLLAALLALTACSRDAPEPVAAVPPSPRADGRVAQGAGEITRYSYEIVAVWPHDRAAFTQGLLFRHGGFLESTGLNGQSTLREVDMKSGRVLKQVALAPQYFAEGLAVVGEQAIQLTWQNRKALVYDADTFQLHREFSYEGEGWGLTTDGRVLILSDGTSRLRFVDPATFAVTRTLEVTAGGQPVRHLNELEYIRGEVFANVWQTNEVVRIDPVSGAVRGVVDFSGLLSPPDLRPDTDVLNGIAYDPVADRLFVTGKRWPKIFEVRLKVRP